jgi:hypothetical protein
VASKEEVVVSLTCRLLEVEIFHKIMAPVTNRMAPSIFRSAYITLNTNSIMLTTLLLLTTAI